MILLVSLLILLWLLIVPTLIGFLVMNQLFKEKEIDLFLAVVCGYICMLAIFYILVMPLFFLDIPFHTLVICWGTVMAYICIMSIIFNRRSFTEIIRHSFNRCKTLKWFTIIVALLILGQVFITVVFQHTDADDAFFVANSTTTLVTDSIFKYDPYTGVPFITFPARHVLSPFPVFVAILSKLLMLHPAILAHTILPIILIPLSYAVFAVLGKRLFPNQPSAVLLFLFFLCVLNIFGNVSIYTNATFLLFRIWQGKAVLANIVLPAILYFSLRAMTEKNNYMEWIMLLACSLAACLVSSMGIVLAPIMIGCLSLVFALRIKTLRVFVYSLVCCAPCIACGIYSVIQ